MQCLYCGKPLGLLRELADGEFCSREHRQRYRTITKRAFGRLMDSRPEPAPFAAPAPLPKVVLPLPQTASPRAGLMKLKPARPRPISVAAARERSPAGPVFQFYNTLMAPCMPVTQGALALAPASSWPLRAPEAAFSPGVALVAAESLAFHPEVAALSPAFNQLQPIDVPLEALTGAVSRQPATEPLSLAPCIQESAAALVPTNGIAYLQASFGPSFEPAKPAPELCGSLPCAPHAKVNAAARAPQMQMAGAPEPLAWAPRPVLPELKVNLLAASVPAASVVVAEARQADAGFEPMQAAAAVISSRRPAMGLAPQQLREPPAVSLLPFPPRPANYACRAAAGAEALPFAAPAPRRLELSLAADRLALRATTALREEVFGADMAADPAGHVVRPNIGTGSVLPALASLFKYGKSSREVGALPHLTEGLTPQNRVAFPVAYRELPMPVQNPRIPSRSELRIVETFEYLKPMDEPPVDILQSLVRLWKTAPVYLRFAAATACLILLMWAVIPGHTVSNMVASRWGVIGEKIEQRAAIELTEDFRDDMSQWTGSGDWVQSWRISRTGYVRPGNLALYQPSMQMKDYRVEFLMQIEQKAVGFAYRATDRENYYAAKLKIAKPGPMPVLSLVRYPVVHGEEGPKVEIPIRILLHNNTPYRVQLTVKGQGYSTSIEGQLVDFWTDSRLQTGGFGFFSDTGESARVYWMRLSHQNDFVGRICAYIRQPAIPRRRTEILQ
ncbi:MAG: hypothetical protein IT159_09515 [Bryobacterales bacterium]|nr:hypothetical protein [Bryobacterales bacterium]